MKKEIILVEGPLSTDQNGELSESILMCAYGNQRCKHLGVHDWHYFYCSAQDAPNQHVKEGEYAYPWRGAGKQLIQGPRPGTTCPYLKEKPDDK